MADSDDPDGVGGFGQMQKNLRTHQAYKKGKDRRKEDTENPQNSGSPKKDGYGNMSPEEKEAYKKGFRGD